MLREPYRSGLAMVSPALGALFQLAWPSLLAGGAWLAAEGLAAFKRRVVRWKIDRAISDLERERKGLGSTPADRSQRAEIDKHLAGLRLARINVIVEGAKSGLDRPPD